MTARLQQSNIHAELAIHITISKLKPSQKKGMNFSLQSTKIENQKISILMVNFRETKILSICDLILTSNVNTDI